MMRRPRASLLASSSRLEAGAPARPDYYKGEKMKHHVPALERLETVAPAVVLDLTRAAVQLRRMAAREPDQVRRTDLRHDAERLCIAAQREAYRILGPDSGEVDDVVWTIDNCLSEVAVRP